MLNPFPDLLVYSFFTPTLLRVAAAVVFGYLAYIHVRDRAHIEAARIPHLGRTGTVLTWAIIALYSLVAFALLLGYRTQYAAVAALLTIVVHLMLSRRYPVVADISRSSYLLLIIICLSLLATGAGAYALDLPL